MTIEKITGAAFKQLFPDRVPDRAPIGMTWKCPKCSRESPTISGLNCGHHEADLYRKD